MNINLNDLVSEIHEKKNYLHGSKLLELFVESEPNNPAALVELGYIYELIGETDKAIKTYDSIDLVSANVFYPRVTHRKLLCAMRLGDNITVDQLFSDAFRRKVKSPWIYSDYIKWSGKKSCRIEVDELKKVWDCCSELPESKFLVENIALHLARFELLQSFDYVFFNKGIHENIIQDFANLYKSKLYNTLIHSQYLCSTFKSSDQIILALEVAIKNGEPFSLIRLGDGEGNFLLGKKLPESIVLTGYKEHIIYNWFGVKSLDREDDLLNLLRSAISNSNVIGIPNLARINYELGNDSRGLWGCIGALSVLSEAQLNTNLVYCNANIHELLFANSSFIQALKNSSSISTISCHSEFGALIRSKLDIAFGEDLICPGEFGIINLPSEKKGGSHWPNAFDVIVDNINKMQAGTVLLVGAGVCGKIYCDVAKRAGLIAIDIGSMADWYSGDMTRAFFKNENFYKKLLI